MNNNLQTNSTYFVMINYDNFSLWRIADIFFTSYVVPKEPHNGQFFAKIKSKLGKLVQLTK